MDKEYLSIKEFASAVGVSQQAIYKQLNNKLKGYLKVVEGKKMLDKSAFALFEKQEDSTDIKQQLLNVLQTELKEKSLRIESLEKQLAEKDAKIEELRAEMAEKNKQTEDKLFEVLQKSQQLAENSQQLQGLLTMEQKQEAVVSEPVVVSEPEEQPKKRWWQFW